MQPARLVGPSGETADGKQGGGGGDRGGGGGRRSTSRRRALEVR